MGPPSFDIFKDLLTANKLIRQARLLRIILQDVALIYRFAPMERLQVASLHARHVDKPTYRKPQSGSPLLIFTSEDILDRKLVTPSVMEWKSRSVQRKVRSSLAAKLPRNGIKHNGMGQSGTGKLEASKISCGAFPRLPLSKPLCCLR